MEHWSDRWLLDPHFDGDCVDLVQNVLHEHFGRQIEFPQRGLSIRAKDAQVRKLRDVYADRVDTREQLREGQIALMRSVGRKQALGHHIGLWCNPAGVWHILHRLASAGVRLTRPALLPALGLELEGVYELRDDIR